MPELPEVECLRRSLEARILGATIRKVLVRRRDVCVAFRSTPLGHRTAALTHAHLLDGARITALRRHGKQLALVADNGRSLCVQLGMTGTLSVLPCTHNPALSPDRHAHVLWHLEDGWLLFRDPRRFGRIRAFDTLDDLRCVCWHDLGPDALTISGERLHRALQKSARPVKAVLLDQGVLAGVGNIYADEALFGACIHPFTSACVIDRHTSSALAETLREVLSRAIVRGGSTIRDYRNAVGEMGSMQRCFAVYGRGGLPCQRCGTELSAGVIAQRTTVWCTHCQGKPDSHRVDHPLTTRLSSRVVHKNRSSVTTVSR